jgi:NADPH:quinone reductase-like Zn-dependent oxidoreductase
MGHLAVQITKAPGAQVTGTTCSARHDLVDGLGADEIRDLLDSDPARFPRRPPRNRSALEGGAKSNVRELVGCGNSDMAAELPVRAIVAP